MPYIPHTDQDRKEMLKVIGVDSLADLFQQIPDPLLLKHLLNLPIGQDDAQLSRTLRKLAVQNHNATQLDWFLGAGIYERYIPPIVPSLISRGEFLTAYTPYQPELSQGSLQTIYEFQTMVAELYGMEMANASMYDGATALAEACLLALAHTGRKRVTLHDSIHPHSLEVVETYLRASGYEWQTVSDWTSVTQEDACVVLQSPDFFGRIHSFLDAKNAALNNGALFVVSSDPIAMALLKPPGAFGADIVVGEGQPLGISMGFGGPMLGLFAFRSDIARKIPGRIVGRTVDIENKSGFSMTLRTREQDIRREKATSNICTNQALMALAATIYLSALGKNGLRTVAEATVRNTQYLLKLLLESGFKLAYPKANVFGEFALKLEKPPSEVIQRMLDHKIMAGYDLTQRYPQLENCMLICVTETKTRAQIERYAETLKKVAN